MDGGPGGWLVNFFANRRETEGSMGLQPMSRELSQGEFLDRATQWKQAPFAGSRRPLSEEGYPAGAGGGSELRGDKPGPKVLTPH